MKETKKEIEHLLKNAPRETQAVITQVFALEKEKLYMSNPHGMPEAIADIIKEIIK